MILKEFKEFAVKGSVVDMAVGIIIGSAFTSVVKSFVDDIMMPPIGLLIGDIDFDDWFFILRSGDPAGPYDTVEAAEAAGAVTLNLGVFLTNAIAFLIVGFAVFLLVRAINRLKRDEPVPPPAEKEKSCPFCKNTIHVDATRCPHCTSELEAAPA